jgi:hypothetical protein
VVEGAATTMNNDINEDPSKEELMVTFHTFKFTIRQSCNSGTSTYKLPALGGSTFETFAYTEEVLASCFIIDHFSNSYSLNCRVPVFSAGRGNAAGRSPTLSTAASVGQECIYLTASVQHEHFDAFNIVLGTWNDLYSTVRHLFVDNVTYCGASSSTSSTTTAVNTADLLKVNNNSSYISIFSGVWIRQDIDNTTAEWDEECVKSFATMIVERGKNKKAINARQALNWITTRSNKRFESISLATNRRGCYNTILSYKEVTKRVFPPDINSSLVASSLSLPGRYSFRPLQQQVAWLGNKSILWSVPVYQHLHQLLEVSADNTNINMNTNMNMNMNVNMNMNTSEIHFMGASHMRYLFLSMIDALYGSEAIYSFHRKVTDGSYRNVAFVTTHFANELVIKSKQFCERGHHQPTHTNRILILQTGDWDLSVGINRFFRDKHFGSALVELILDLIEGRYECPGLRKVILLTGVPYPTCTTDLGEYCADQRCFRFNTNIAAINAYLLNRLMAATIAPAGIQLQIVDAYDIIVPRIQLNENVEMACTNHFSCAVEWHHRTEMVHGAAGMALVQSLLYALTN